MRYYNYPMYRKNDRFAGSFFLPFALGFASAPLILRPRPYAYPPYPYYSYNYNNYNYYPYQY